MKDQGMTPQVRYARLRTNIPPLDHALKASMLQANRGLRLSDAAFGAARLMAEGGGASAWEELWAIGDAARDRLGSLQKAWAHDWFEWVQYASEVGGAGTVTKLSARELNIVNQAAQLFSEQSVALIALFENIEMDVLYWICERAGLPPAPDRPEPPSAP